MELREILQKKINKLGVAKQVTASQVCDAYNKAVVEIFGKDASEFTEAISFKKGVLKVRVSSSSWAQEVQGKSFEIIEKINKSTKINNLVARIMFN